MGLTRKRLDPSKPRPEEPGPPGPKAQLARTSYGSVLSSSHVPRTVLALGTYLVRLPGPASPGSVITDTAICVDDFLPGHAKVAVGSSWPGDTKRPEALDMIDHLIERHVFFHR